MYYLYILRNKENSFYIGTTNNLDRRLQQHNTNQSNYTKNRGPWELVFSEEFSNRSDAMKREYYLKSLKSKTVLQKIIYS